MNLPLPSVHFLLLLRKDALAAPGAVEGLRAGKYHGLHDREEILLTWNPPESRAVCNHEIERRCDGSAWEALPHPPLLDGSFLDARNPLPAGAEYRVRTKDYEGRFGPWSEIVRA